MKTIKTLLAAALAIASGTAAAVTLTLNVVNGTWSDIAGGKNVEYRDGGKEVRWGGNTNHKDKSGYRFAANPDLPITFDSSETFSLGIFTHYNEPIPTGSAITSATLNVATELDILGTSIADGPYQFSFGHNETLNNACNNILCWIFGGSGTGPVDDIVMLDTSVQSNEFIVDSYVFSLEIIGFQGLNQYSTLGKKGGKKDPVCVASPIVNGTLYTK